MRLLFSTRLGRSSVGRSAEGEPATSPEVDATPEGTTQPGAVGQHRRYYSLLRRTRLMLVAFWAVLFFFLLWAIPWVPGGLSEEDYTRQLALTLALGSVCAALGVGSLVLRENLRRTRQALLAWRMVYDDTTGLLNRRYFLDRLSLECERARRQGHVFSLILMRLERTADNSRDPSASVLRRLGAALRTAARSDDPVALLGSSDLAVIAMGVPGRMVGQVADRLTKALEGFLADSDGQLSLRLGTATFGARVRDPGSLLREARRSLSAGVSLGGAAGKQRSAA